MSNATSDARALATDPLLSAFVFLPGEALAKARTLIEDHRPGIGCNIPIYGRKMDGMVNVRVGDVISAFEAALTLVVANGQLATEAMTRAGFNQAEIDDRITRFTGALHAASTSNPGGVSTNQSAPAFASPDASERRRDDGSGHRHVGAVPAPTVVSSSPAVSGDSGDDGG